MNHLVAPSFLSANFLTLEKEIYMVNQSEADWFHLDIMDGHFVPNISFGFPIIEQIRKKAEKPLDVHLMITEPDRYIERFKSAGADILTVHVETCNHLHRTVQSIKALGMKAGVSLNPHTPVSSLTDILNEIDMVLIMSVNPGFGGQKFIGNTYDKIRKLKNLILESGLQTLIEVDGGVDNTNAQKLVEAGTDVLVAGSFIFSSPKPLQTISRIKQLNF